MILHFLVHLTSLAAPFLTMFILYPKIENYFIETYYCDQLESGEMQLEETQFLIKEIIFDYTMQSMIGIAAYLFIFELGTTICFAKMMSFEFACYYNIVKLIAAFTRRLTQNLQSI